MYSCADYWVSNWRIIQNVMFGASRFLPPGTVHFSSEIIYGICIFIWVDSWSSGRPLISCWVLSAVSRGLYGAFTGDESSLNLLQGHVSSFGDPLLTTYQHRGINRTNHPSAYCTTHQGVYGPRVRGVWAESLPYLYSYYRHSGLAAIMVTFERLESASPLKYLHQVSITLLFESNRGRSYCHFLC